MRVQFPLLALSKQIEIKQCAAGAPKRLDFRLLYMEGVIMKKYLQYKPITKDTLPQYLQEKFGTGVTIVPQKERVISNVTPLLQEDYGLASDCTITSMTCLLEYLYRKPIQQIYDSVEANARKFGYTGNFGTIPFFINAVLKRSEKQLVNKETKWKSGYLKGIGYSFNTIVKLTEQNKPMILSLWNDGRGYYKDHSITAIGYAQYLVNGKQQRFIIVQDNWHKEKAYVDYETLCVISSLNYY